ncbi:MFS transporter [Actinocorallia lasiicapitis]
MYLSTIDRAAVPRRGAVSRTVVALGAVSLVTDVSAEMVAAVLPLYLMAGLQLGPAAYGVIDGVYTGATVLLRLFGGVFADRIQRRKPVAAFGYGLSAVAKLGLLLAGPSVPLLGAAVTADRAGKGLRTAPRDALITLSTPPELLGRAFGVHRTMDAVGAFAGPLVALAVLQTSGQRFEPVFMTSFCVAAMGVVLLLLFVTDHRDTRPAPPRFSAAEARILLRGRAVRRLLPAAVLLGLVTIGDGFVYLLLQRKNDYALGWFPLLAVGTSLCYLLLAAPCGLLADRWGRGRVLLAGFAPLIGVYLLVGAGPGGIAETVGVVALYGLFYATTDGVLMALAGPLLPEELRTTGIALIQSGQALAYLGSSVLFGFAWQLWGAAPAVLTCAALAVTAAGATLILLREEPAR